MKSLKKETGFFFIAGDNVEFQFYRIIKLYYKKKKEKKDIKNAS